VKGFLGLTGIVQEPCLYAYAYPEPDGFNQAVAHSEQAFYSEDLNEFLLPYDVVSSSERPDETLLAFLQGTYEVAANPGNWDRAALDRPKA
jgi:hypothetical protein